MAVEPKAPPVEEKLITGEQLYEMIDVDLCELIEGRIVRMNPIGFRHGAYEIKIAAKLQSYVETTEAGVIFGGEVGIYTRRNPDSIRAADVAFVSNETFSKIKSESFLDIAPELIVEIMSPGDAWSEVTVKLREYFDIGVKLVWIADPDSKSIFAHRSVTDVKEFTSDEDLIAEDILPGFSVPVSELFKI